MCVLFNGIINGFFIFAGFRLAEYEVFIQYYNKLMISLKNYELFSDCVDRWDYVMIRRYIDMVISKDDLGLEARTSEDTFKPKTKDISIPVRMSSQKVSLSGTEFSERAVKTGMLLAMIAIKLYYFNTGSFYKILEFMQSNKEDPGVRKLATEILSKVKAFDPLNSSSMNINVICTYVGVSYTFMVLVYYHQEFIILECLTAYIHCTNALHQISPVNCSIIYSWI